jgi:hypothetical protein
MFSVASALGGLGFSSAGRHSAVAMWPKGQSAGMYHGCPAPAILCGSLSVAPSSSSLLVAAPSLLFSLSSFSPLRRLFLFWCEMCETNKHKIAAASTTNPVRSVGDVYQPS